MQAVSFSKFNVIESTLREGEQFEGCHFSLDDKIEIAAVLDAFGVEYMELTTPLASPQSEATLRAVARLPRGFRLLTHIRARMDEARLAVDCGVDGVDIYIGTSAYMRQFSHGRSLQEIIDSSSEIVAWLKGQGIETRFSTEDTFRSNLADVFTVYRAMDLAGVDRVGVADTVGIADPLRTHSLISSLRQVVNCDIEFHGHDDSGCAVANAWCALQAGATHVDTTVLGIGERNGITALGGLVARLYTFNPEDFGIVRNIDIAHRLVGWNAVRDRAATLGMALDEPKLRAATLRIKALADERRISLADVDQVLQDAVTEPG